jgi:hypothetical protein
MNENNPFKGMDNTTSPQELIRTMINKAAEDNNIKMLGGVLGVMQKQIESVAQHAGQVMNSLEGNLSHVIMSVDVTRLITSLLINILIEKNVVTKEEFETLYQEKVVDVMDKFMEQMAQQQKEAEEAKQKEIEEFVKMASSKDGVFDPETGQEVDPKTFEPIENEIKENLQEETLEQQSNEGQVIEFPKIKTE